MKKINLDFFKRDSRAEILTENIIFLVLNFIFLTIMILFIYSHATGAVLLEESYAKNIALLIDSSSPGENGMDIYLNMEKALKKAEKNNWNFQDIITINENVVRIQLTKDTGYSYSFFNDVEVNVNYDRVREKGFYFSISKKEPVILDSGGSD